MTCDVIVLGSSFTGSLLAWILASRGMRVIVLDRGRHPRFAVGESSTPTADATIARIAARWDLPALAPLARYGTWRRARPELGRGLKRGFSYFQHRPGEPFADGPAHEASLLVAASASDEESDTHWVRADVDAFFFEQAVAAGADCREEATIESLDGPRDSGPGDRAAPCWSVRWRSPEGTGSATAPRLVDATGGGGVLAAHLGLDSLSSALTTRTAAVYSHVAGLGSWDRLRLEAGDASTVSPFRSDDAAQHHLLANGWVWMLRFDDDRASVGIVTRHDAAVRPAAASPGALWEAGLADYPDVRRLFAGARMLRPLATIDRISRLWARASGPGWAMLPTTAGFVDPLHSTGIAHGLSGVERVASLLLAERHDEPAWLAYGSDVVDEVRWIDALVGACYAAIPDFELFRLASTLYFLAVVASERADAAGLPPSDRGFLSAKNAPLRRSLTASLAALRQVIASAPSGADRAAALAAIRADLAPWDQVGLLDHASRNRIAHTAARKPAA
jgi:tetracycline 7-halogenase / FADH2 O2-dependent halogenase